MIVYVARLIELIGGLFLTIELAVRIVSFLCRKLMAAAYWLAHGTKALLPIQKGGEPSMFYCFLFLVIASHGAGMWSMDAGRGDA